MIPGHVPTAGATESRPGTCLTCADSRATAARAIALNMQFVYNAEVALRRQAEVFLRIIARRDLEIADLKNERARSIHQPHDHTQEVTP